MVGPRGTVIGVMEAPPAAILARDKAAARQGAPGRMAPATARFFAAIGLGEIKTQPDDRVNWRTRVLWEEADRRGIVMREFRRSACRARSFMPRMAAIQGL